MESQIVEDCKEIFYVFKETKTKEFLCPHKECKGKVYKHQNKILAHLRTHFGFKPFKCSHCNKAFNEKGNLKTHIRIHTGERPFQCDKCTKAFKAFGQLKEHQLSHLGLKPFECHICHKQYRRKEILKNHLHIHEKESMSILSPSTTDQMRSVLSSTSLVSEEHTNATIETPFDLFISKEDNDFMFSTEENNEGFLILDNNSNDFFSDFNMAIYKEEY